MRTFQRSYLLIALSYAAGCSSGAAPPPLNGTGSDSGKETSVAPGVDSGHKTDSSSGGDSGPPPPAGFYVPKGCDYGVTPSTTFMSVALDDSSAAGATPLRVRLGLGGNVVEGQPGYPDPTTTGAFTWETAAANGAAQLKIGTSASSLTQTQSGYTWTVPIGSDALASPMYMHEVHICGLTPATTYYYQVGGGSGSGVWSATQSFTTLPATGDVLLGVMGDARDVVTTWQTANEHLKQKNVDAMLFTGDLTLLGISEAEYTSWLDAIWQGSDGGAESTLGEIMFIPVAGNHEFDVSSDVTDSQWLASFAVPGAGAYAKSYGSYNIGNAHFIYIDDNALAGLAMGTDNPQVDAQLAWLKQDLAAANADRTKHPFIFALEHRGIFSTSVYNATFGGGHSTDPDVLQARTTLAPIFAQGKVDGVFAGHDHEYERSMPIVPGNPITGAPTPTTGGTTYVICAGVGANPYPGSSGDVSWRAQQLSFGTAGTGASAAYLGVYSTLKLSGNTAVLTVYGLTSGGADPVIDTYPFTH